MHRFLGQYLFLKAIKILCRVGDIKPKMGLGPILFGLGD
jgi:hypothetical protein